MIDLRSSDSAIALRSSALSNGGASRLMIRLVLTLIGASLQIAFGSCFMMSCSSAYVSLGREGHVDFAGNKGKHRRRTVLDDGVFDAVEIRQALFPVVRVLHELDQFVLLHLDEFERAGADRMRAHLRRRHVAGIDRRIAGGEHRQQRGLRPLEMEGRLVVAIDGDVGDIVRTNPCADFCGTCLSTCLAAGRRCISRRRR